ncbi:hypothetical protein RhiirC2_738012 [Rhizophagus irregularis]|uniref:Uncharacterized protein n=1 Tax=Rhizophagus irregularis TaxID=588596 RepID=A0A2N1NLT6_9GLOM|nr:hypothetical protein RhiirC2_738012 [Rhizophagus irregularis]
MFGFSSLLPPDWVRLHIIAGIPAFLVIYTVLPSAIYTARHRSSKGNWYIPPEPTDESPSMQAKLLLLNSLAVLFSVKYIAQYIFNHPGPEIFVTGALLTVILITVVIYHYENRGIVKPAIPLSLMFMLEWASPRTPVESVSFTATTPEVTQSNDTSQTEKVSTEESKHSKSE